MLFLRWADSCQGRLVGNDDYQHHRDRVWGRLAGKPAPPITKPSRAARVGKHVPMMLVKFISRASIHEALAGCPYSAAILLNEEKQGPLGNYRRLHELARERLCERRRGFTRQPAPSTYAIPYNCQSRKPIIAC